MPELTIVLILVNGFVLALLAGAFVKLKLIGGAMIDLHGNQHADDADRFRRSMKPSTGNFLL